MDNVKLSEDPNVPVLDGWVNITEAAEILGITRQHSYKKAKLFNQPGGYKTLHRIGNQPAYVVALSELEEIIARRAEKAREKEARQVAKEHESTS